MGLSGPPQDVPPFVPEDRTFVAVALVSEKPGVLVYCCNEFYSAKFRRNFRMVNVKSKSFVSVVLVAVVLFGVCFYFLSPRLTREEDGWVYKETFEWNMGRYAIEPVAVNGKLVVLERHRYRMPFVRHLRQFVRDTYKLRAFSLATGKQVFVTTIRNDRRLVQVYAMCSWQGHVLLVGYHQYKPGLLNRHVYIYVVNGDGKVIEQFPITFFATIFAVDNRNNLLLCVQSYGKRDLSDGMSSHMLRAFRLPSGEEVFSHSIDPVSDVTADKSGNVYLLNFSEDRVEYNRGEIDHCSAWVHKYSLLPWKKSWSVEITPPMGHPELLAFEGGLLHYALYDKYGGHESGARRKWMTDPLDPETGASVEGAPKHESYTIVVEDVSQIYVIQKIEGGLRITERKP